MKISIEMLAKLKGLAIDTAMKRAIIKELGKIENKKINQDYLDKKEDKENEYFDTRW